MRIQRVYEPSKNSTNAMKTMAKETEMYITN